MGPNKMFPLWAALLVTASGCGTGAPTPGAAGGETAMLASFPAESAKRLRVSLTDAPARDLTAVFVNVRHVELFLRKGANEARVRIAEGLGAVDLMTLRNGVLLPLEDLDLAPGIEITRIRLVLAPDGNHARKLDGSTCAMQTPSGQQSGIKINLAAPVLLENGYTYSMVLDFDARKSVVVKGNGDCLLKPVLKLLQVARAEAGLPGDGGVEPVTGGDDGNEGESDSGFDDGYTPDDPADPPVITIEDSYNLP